MAHLLAKGVFCKTGLKESLFFFWSIKKMFFDDFDLADEKGIRWLRRRRLWLLWTVYVTYFMDQTLWSSVIVPFVVELFELFIVTLVLWSYTEDVRNDDSFFIVEVLFRAVSCLVSAVVLVTVQWSFDFASVKGIPWVAIIGIIVFMSIMRAVLSTHWDLFIIPMSLLLIFCARDHIIFTEWSTYASLTIGAIGFIVILYIEYGIVKLQKVKNFHHWTFVIPYFVAWAILLISAGICQGVCHKTRYGFGHYV